MNSRIIHGPEITRPNTTPLGSSILDHATVKENGKFGLRNNEGLWPSYNCLNTNHDVTLCAVTPEFKTFDSVDWIPAFEFANQAGTQCMAVGLDRADMEAETRRVFGLNEAKGIEQALVAQRFIADPDGKWDAPTDLTVTPAPSLVVALAILEGYAASVYAGVPTIHMSRASLSLLGDRITWVGGKAYTLSGSKVAAGGGIVDVGGNWTLYATGEVFIERSETVDIQSFVLPGDGSGIGSDENGLADNTAVTLLERMYRVAVDCFAAKATGVVIA